jgi:hypothetical protein
MRYSYWLGVRPEGGVNMSRHLDRLFALSYET